MRKITCIECPMGCDIEVEVLDGKVVSINGNTCPRGRLYAENEVVCPKRVITTTVMSKSGKPVPVKTDAPVKKENVFSLMKRINAITVDLPVKIGDVVESDFADGANLVVAGNVSDN